MTPEDDADLVAAEQLTQAWLDDNGYVGRRRALPDDVLDDLISSRLAVLLGQPGDHVMAMERALQKLYRAGYDHEEALAAIRRMRVRVDIDAARIVADMMDVPVGVCPDPAGHARLEAAPAQERRMPPKTLDGACDWCGLAIPGGVA